MFTGIIKDIGRIKRISRSHHETRFDIATALDLSAVPMGASIACSGCCLTVVDKTETSFAVEVSGETLTKTNLGTWQENTPVNLEMSLRLGDEMGGHLVSGHVDGVAEVVRVTPEGGSHRFTIRAPGPLAPFIASKGSVALEGISLTVNEVEGDVFGVNIIPYTWEHTNFSFLRPGDKINLEIDVLARYVRRLMEQTDARQAAA